MSTLVGNNDDKFLSWLVFRDLSYIENNPQEEDRLGINYGLISFNNTIISTSDIPLDGNLNISQKSTVTYPTSSKDVFLDLQTSKYLYAKLTKATNTVELEYSSQPPFGANAITINTSTYQRIPLAYITENKTVIDLRPIGGSGGGSGSSSTPEPFDITLSNGTITLWPGNINQLVPNGMFSSFDYSGGVVYVYAHVVTNGRQVTSSTLTVSSSGPSVIATSQSQAPTAFDVLFGIVSNNTVYQISNGNVQASIYQTHVEDKSNPIVGSSPINRYFSWSIAFI